MREKKHAEKWQVIKNEFLNLLKVVFKHFNASIIFLTLKKLALSFRALKIQVTLVLSEDIGEFLRVGGSFEKGIWVFKEQLLEGYTKDI